MCKRLKFGHTNKWYLQKPESVLENEMHKIFFVIQMNPPILARPPDLVLFNKKKRTCYLMDFAFPVDYRVKIKESKTIDNYQDLAGELKKLWNMKVIVIPVVVGAFGMVPKGLEKRLRILVTRRRIKTIPTTALLKSAKILRVLVS